MDEVVRSEIAGTSGLALLAIVALVLTLRRDPAAAPADDHHRTTMLFIVGLVVHALHFWEEYATAFYERFPLLLGLASWPSRFFLAFNFVCLVIWSFSVIGFRMGFRLAFFPVWFFALAATANGIAHPVLALRVGGYFPGLITSPLLGALGIWLLVRLAGMTQYRAHAG